VNLLVLDRNAVREALPMARAIATMKEALRRAERGPRRVARSHAPVRRAAGRDQSDHGGLRERRRRRETVLAVKVVSVFERNASAGLARAGAVLAIDPATGEPQGCSTARGAHRDPHGSRIRAATDLLAREDSQTLAVLGAGVQARTHIEAICAVRPIRTVYCYSRTREKLEAMIAELVRDSPADRRFVAAASPAEALRQADIVAVTTSSGVPVFEDADVREGTHINAIGAYTPETSEVPALTVARALVVVDSRAAAAKEAGDLIQAQRAGLIGEGHIHAELGEIVLGTRPGRSNDRIVTLFKSVGSPYRMRWPRRADAARAAPASRAPSGALTPPSPDPSPSPLVPAPNPFAPSPVDAFTTPVVVSPTDVV
jgi:ornithine cyclodeaminase